MTLEDALRDIDGVLNVQTNEIRGTTATSIRLVSGKSPQELIETLQTIEDTRPAHFEGIISTEGHRNIIVEYEHPDHD